MKRRGRPILAVVAVLAALVPVSAEVSAPVGGKAADRVEVPDRGDETTKVFANANGSYTMEQHVQPVRVRRGNGWVPVDNTLAVRPDGTIAPAASSTPLVLSPGGTAPFARFGADDRQLTLRWPGELPKPVLNGDEATYPEVMPGIDLRVKAKPQGFSHVFVVKTPQAARDPRLAKLTFGMQTKGITVRTDADGMLIAVDKAGAVVFQAPPPRMWDANPERRPVTMPVTVTDKELTLTPDQRLLTDPAARFPIEIDPDWSSGRNAWALVYAQHPNDSYWFGDGDGVGKVGYSGTWEPKAVTVRSYFQFDVWDLAGKDIVSAEFNIFQKYSASCIKTGTWLNQYTPISGGTTWNQPGSWLRHFGYYEGQFGRSACPARSIGWNVRDAVANPWDGRVTFLLHTDEGDQNAWRKFDPNTPALIVTYNDAPWQPWSLSIHDKECNGVDPDIATPTPVLRATVGDPNGGLVHADFEWFVRNGDILGSYRSPVQDSGNQFSMTIPPDVYANGSGIAWRVRGWDGRVWGPWSIWCGAGVDTTKPDKPPLVSSVAYPENGEGGAPGLTGQFEFGSNGVADVAAFKYRLSGHEEQTVPATNGSAVAFVTPPTSDPFTLEVTSVDKAGNRATQENTKKYQFRVGLPTQPVAHWPLDGYHTTTNAPDVIRGNNATVNAIGPAIWTQGRINDGIKLSGNADSFLSTQRPAVDTSKSFTVSAWVRLDRAADLWYSALTQEGDKVPGFALQYAGNSRSWSFSMLSDDVINPTIEQAFDPKPPVLNQWTHLTGTYNASDRKMSLYVNGRLAGSTTRQGKNWFASGGVQIGRGEWNGNLGDYWPGAIDDVRIYDRALPDIQVAGPTEVDKGAIQPTTRQAVFAFDEKTGTKTTDLASFHEGTLTNGPTWTAGKVGTGALKFDGNDDHVATTVPVLRTDNSYTVSAWARQDAINQGTLVSQDGANGSSAFHLQYRNDTKSWSFVVARESAAKPFTYLTYDRSPPQLGWSQITGVYDASVPEIRLYVNGAMVDRKAMPEPLNWSAPGGLMIGRGQWNNLQVDKWNGWIDEVHAYTGVRTDDQIRNDYLNPGKDRTPQRGSLGRYVNQSGDHFITTGGVPPGYRLEGSLGWLAAADAPGTRLLYSCTAGTDQFVSVQADCEGQRVLSTLGPVYAEAPQGATTHAIYRCLTTGRSERFVSIMPNCEGNVVDSLLGYTRPYHMLYRSVRHEGNPDSSSDTGAPPGGYVIARPLGGLPSSQVPGTRALMQCLHANQRFSSVLDCEGQTKVRQIGWIWQQQPPDLDTVELYRCRNTTNRDHFDSTDPDCEGQEKDGPLGFVLRETT